MRDRDAPESGTAACRDTDGELDEFLQVDVVRLAVRQPFVEEARDAAEHLLKRTRR